MSERGVGGRERQRERVEIVDRRKKQRGRKWRDVKRQRGDRRIAIREK